MVTSTLAATWFRPRPPNPQAKVRLLGFPYAGGTASIFNSWPSQLPPFVEVCALHLPGRESRFREQPFTRLEPLVESLAEGILPLCNKPFAFFGHSMGALIGFELIRFLQKQYQTIPFHFFASGCSAPQMIRRDRHIHHLPEPEFLRELRRLNGTPKSVLEHAELMKLMIPIMRADFEICETYAYSPEPPLNCPITAFGGSQDRDVSKRKIAGWRDQTNAHFSQYMFPGDHFFLHTAEKQLLHRIGLDLLTNFPREGA